MSKGRHKTNGSGQEHGVATMERTSHDSEDRKQILAYRRPQRPAAWQGDPFPMVRSIAEELDRVFEGFGMGSSLVSQWPTGLERGMATWAPAVELLHQDGSLVIRAELPGVSKEDIHVEVTDEMVSIHGERRDEHEESNQGYFRSERSYGSFLRTVALPEGAQADEADASFRDGVLEIRIPTPERQESRRRRLDVKD